MWQIKDAKVVSKYKIQIHNLSKTVETKDLAADFSICGNIFSCKIPESVRDSDCI